jgi:multicomponent Na+:H+ antiporter subunit D
MLGALEADQLVMVAVLAVSTLLNIAYLMPLVVRGFLLPGKDGDGGGLHEAPLACVGPLVFTAAGCIGLFFLAEPFTRLLGELR